LGTVHPSGAVTRTTRAPWRSAMSASRAPKKPATPTTTVSPGSSRFANPASIAVVPVAGRAMTSPVGIRHAVRSIATTWSRIAWKSGSRWPSIGRRIAASTAGSTSDGPGPQSSRAGGSSVVGIDMTEQGPAAAARAQPKNSASTHRGDSMDRAGPAPDRNSSIAACAPCRPATHCAAHGP
jgi:hypothetical protein